MIWRNLFKKKTPEQKENLSKIEKLQKTMKPGDKKKSKILDKLIMYIIN
jgi:hypothetical protein